MLQLITSNQTMTNYEGKPYMQELSKYLNYYLLVQDGSINVVADLLDSIQDDLLAKNKINAMH